MPARPAPPTQAIRAEAGIVLNRALGGASRLLRLRVPAWPGARPGQFLMLSPGALAAVRRDDPLLPRPMAVFREHPAPGEITHDRGGSSDGAHAHAHGHVRAHGDVVDVDVLYKVAGRGTSLLAAAREDEVVRVLGPLGQGFAPPVPGSRIVVIGGGTGIASLYGLAAAAARSCRVTVVLGARSERDLMAQEEFAALDLELVVVTEDGSVGEQGLATAPLERALAQGDVATVYSCGPTPMMRRCAELAAESEVACVVSLENNMACGYGVCLGCAAPRPAGNYALVCCEGPVFDANEIQWDRLP